MNDQEFLKHFGVLGMRWGVRRRHGKVTKAKTKKTTDDDDEKKEVDVEEYRKMLLNTTSAKTLYANRKALSDKDLKERISRIQMEKQLSDMARGEKKSVMTYADNVLKAVKTVSEFYNLYNSPMGKDIRALLTKKKA